MEELLQHLNQFVEAIRTHQEFPFLSGEGDNGLGMAQEMAGLKIFRLSEDKDAIKEIIFDYLFDNKGYPPPEAEGESLD